MNIPNFHDIAVVEQREDKKFYFTEEWQNIMISLLQTLQQNASDEGLVAPTQPQPGAPNTAIADIQNHIITVNGNTVYTCQFGTSLYDRLNNSIRMAIDDGTGAPIFKTVTLT